MPPGFLREGFLLETFFLAAGFLADFLEADLLDADFVLTAAFFFAGAFFFVDERFTIARFFADLRAGFFLAMPQVYQMFLSLRSNRQQLILRVEIRLRSMQRSSATVVPRCFIFIIKTSSQAHDNPISLAFSKAIAPSALPVIAAVLFWS